MPRLVFLDGALDDLVLIARDIASNTGSPDPAFRFTDQLIAKCERLAGLPGTLGRSRDELSAGIRSFAYKSYVIFFRYGGSGSAWDRFEVVNILEGHRDFVRYFGDDSDQPQES